MEEGLSDGGDVLRLPAEQDQLLLTKDILHQLENVVAAHSL